MTTKHTPGPWAITREDIESGEIALHITRKLTNVCVVYSYDREDKKRNEWADARLIAAAPDLLAALEAAHGYLVMMGTDHADHIRSVCLAAILKAQGKKP